MTGNRSTEPQRVYAGKSQQQRQQERYEQLVDAGVAVFGDSGYRAASVNAICREAGLTKRYFYESFADREALLKAVYLRLNEQLGEEIVTELLRSAPQPTALVRSGATAFFRALRREPRTARIILFEAVNISGALAELNREVEARFVAGIRQAVNRYGPHREIDEDREALVVAGLFGAAVNIAMRWVLDGYRQPLEDVVESTVLIYEGVMRQVWDDPGGA